MGSLLHGIALKIAAVFSGLAMLLSGGANLTMNSSASLSGTTTQSTTTAQVDEIEQLRAELNELKSQSASNVLQSAKAQSSAQITKAPTTKENGPQDSKSLDNNELQTIMSRIVYVECSGDKGTFSGSGTAQLIPYSDPVVVTNFHVPGSTGGISQAFCKINVPQPPDYSLGLAYLATIGKFDTHYPDIDAVVLHIQGVSTDNQQLFRPFPLRFCDAATIEIGDKITVLGYPAFGEQIGTGVQSLTVTDGIISGFIKTNHGTIYKTSAKVDHGISGGLAVRNQDSCVLGIPTWGNYGGSLANIGAGEVLGQIQSWDMIRGSGDIFPGSQPSPQSSQVSDSPAAQPSTNPSSLPSTPQNDEAVAESYYHANNTCVGLSGDQYGDCLSYAYNH
jgi:hypothetical protein